MILVTGATGGTGSELVRLLSESDHPFRCMVRRPEALGTLSAQGIDAVLGDFDAPETLPSALGGVDKLYLVCTPDQHLADREIAMIDAAKQAGVSKIVKLSAFWTDLESPSPNLRLHAASESHLKSSGIDYTIIRPHGFFQTVFWMSAATIESQGLMPAPAGQGDAPYLDIRDVALAVLTCLTEDRHHNQTYEITGPASLTMDEIAGILSKSLGKTIVYADIPPEQMSAAMKAMGVAGSSVAHVAYVFRRIREGTSSFTTDTLGQLGITPRSWADFAADLSAGKTGMATSFKPPAPPA